MHASLLCIQPGSRGSSIPLSWAQFFIGTKSLPYQQTLGSFQQDPFVYFCFKVPLLNFGSVSSFVCFSSYYGDVCPPWFVLTMISIFFDATSGNNFFHSLLHTKSSTSGNDTQLTLFITCHGYHGQYLYNRKLDLLRRQESLVLTTCPGNMERNFYTLELRGELWQLQVFLGCLVWKFCNMSLKSGDCDSLCFKYHRLPLSLLKCSGFS